MIHERFVLKQDLVVERLITFFYKDYPKDFYHLGEKHDFWEMLYVDKGEMEIHTDNNQYVLKQGECVFYKPNEFHKGGAYQQNAPTLIVITFDCSSPYMSFFEGKSFRFRNQERDLLCRLIEEGNVAFSPPVESPESFSPKRRADAPFASEQLIKNYLEILLITLLRRGAHDKQVIHLTSSSKQKADQELADQVIRYLEQHLHTDLSLGDVGKAVSVSTARLKTLFREQTGMTTMRYFNKMKMDHAKHLIREGRHTFTEIAELLGFSSIHYFSRHFKKFTSMTPSEYGRSVRSHIRLPEE